MSNFPVPANRRFGVAAPGSPAPIPRGSDRVAEPEHRRMRWWVRLLLVVASLVVAVGIGYGCYQWGHGSVKLPSTQSVLVTTRAIPAGGRIIGNDLRTQVVQTPGNRYKPAEVPGQQSSAVLGKIAAQALPAGTILSPRDLALPGSVPIGDQALVGLSLKPSQVPVGGLSVGERVGIIGVPAAVNGKPAGAPVPITDAPVWDIAISSDGTINCDVTVPNRLAATLSGASSLGELTLIRLSPTAVFPPPGS